MSREKLTEIMHLASAGLLDDSRTDAALAEIAELMTPRSWSEAKAAAPHDAALEFSKGDNRKIVIATLPSGRKLSATLLTLQRGSGLPNVSHAELFDDSSPVCHIEFFGQYAGDGWSFPIVRRALNGLMSRAGHRQRIRRNRRKSAVED